MQRDLRGSLSNVPSMFLVHLSLSDLSKGLVTLENKQGRISRLTDRLGEIRTLGKLHLHEAQILHGLMGYACGFFAGRQLQQVCSEIFALTRPGFTQDSRAVTDFCSYALKSLADCRLEAAAVQSPILILQTGLGGIVRSSGDWDGSSQVLHGLLPDVLLDLWLKEVGDQLICQIELYASCAEMAAWKLADRAV